MKLPKLIIQKLDQPKRTLPITGLRLMLSFNILICGAALVYDKLNSPEIKDPIAHEEKLLEAEAKALRAIEKQS